MFNVNDTVLYGIEGVCRITELTERDFRGKKVKYYVLKPVYKENATLFVPMDNKTLVGKMRIVPTAEEIKKIIREMPAEESIWIEDENTRKARYKEIIAGGDSRELVQLIKTLYLHQKEQRAKGKKLHMAEERFFKEAEKMLYDEFAVVLGMKPGEVLPFILKQIDEA